MNPNYSNSDQEPDPSDPNEGSENEGSMTFSTQDYPELEGLKDGEPVTVTCQASVQNNGDGTVSLNVEPGSCQFQTTGPADKAMKQMSQQDSYANAGSGDQSSGEDF